METYESLYFNRDVTTADKVKNLFSMMKDASLTDITCIEELLGKLIAKDAFEPPVYNSLWQAYLNHGGDLSHRNEELNPGERRNLI